MEFYTISVFQSLLVDTGSVRHSTATLVY